MGALDAEDCSPITTSGREKIKKYLRRRTVSPPSPTNVEVDQMKKCAELAIYQAGILNDQVTQLQGNVQRQKKKARSS
ncbi:hypothetical protein V1517DRAFT_334420 [Lipomyces orientalis]|uniref:Uncharacterized protein n=1 Tax=Lipomyces orientalis TaxID=1233043 RepID=A0ACC3TCX5_9ASCO